MSDILEANPKYNGTHTCPKCGAPSHWTCVNQSPVILRVACDGECGTFESAYSELQSFPHFDKPVEKLAIQ